MQMYFTINFMMNNWSLVNIHDELYFNKLCEWGPFRSMNLYL